MTASSESLLQSLRARAFGEESHAIAPTTARPKLSMAKLSERILEALDHAPKLLDDDAAARVACQGRMVLSRFDSFARAKTAQRAANRLEAVVRVMNAFSETLRWCASSDRWESIAGELATDVEALRDDIEALLRRERELAADIHRVRGTGA